jgi:uncharacterized OB-fold protein
MKDSAAGFPVGQCRQCGALYFPRRLICHRCGGDTWGDAFVREAVVEEATTVSHAIGQERPAPRHLATVRTPEGLHLIVGLEMPAEPGTRVALIEKDGAPFAR